MLTSSSWGITAEQSERGEVMELCLTEIDKCNYFINIIGNRYGYVPSKIPDFLRAKYPWLPNTEKETNAKSVTEFEVLHAALNGNLLTVDGQTRRNLFYFRKCATSGTFFFGLINHLSLTRR